MHIDFNPDNINWGLQPHSDLQYGGSTYTAFSGMPYQRGAGIGSIFRSVLRFLLPIGKALGQQGLSSGAKVLGNISEGQDLKEALLDEGRVGIKSLLDKASKNFEKQKGSGVFDFNRYKKVGKGPMKKHINTKKKVLKTIIGPPSIPSSSSIITAKPPKRKRIRIDSLGSY